MTIGVYMIEHVATGRRYIGKSIDVEHRVQDHFKFTDVRCNSAIRHAIVKHGRDAFVWSVLDVCADDATARAQEVFWIEFLDTKSPYGFNLTDGGDGVCGLPVKPETRTKMRAAKLGKPGNHTGHRHSEETKKRIALAKLGSKQSAEVRAKHSAAMLGNKHNVGRKLSEETRAKMRLSQRNRRQSEKEVTNA